MVSPDLSCRKPKFMIISALACQAQCSYCFGPNRGPIMQQEVFDASVDWIASYGRADERVEITFHGGEPLLAGKEWYKKNLPILQLRFEGRLKLSIQSNLWLLDDEFCSLFKEFGVSIGASLDGPEMINDAQRGKGYFARTMAGIEAARRNGLILGVICTFTHLSAPHYREVFEFFASQGLSFSVHEAVSTLESSQNGARFPEPALTLLPDEAATLMVDLFDYYLENLTRTKISTFDSMARGLSTQNGAICTFGDCLGKYLTIAPGGEIFSCNRFVYHLEWQIGSVFDHPTETALTQCAAWQKLRQRELTVGKDCGDCTHFDYCKGGCPYNAFTSGFDRRDSQCPVYRRLFDHIRDRALDEVFSDENLEAIVQHDPGKDGKENRNDLMRKGRLIQIMKGGLHPQEAARKARETVAAVALACSASPEEAVDKLDWAGIITQREAALGSLRSLRQRLDSQSRQGLVNAYLHVTYTCNLSCSHCYAQAGPRKSASMRVEEVDRLGREAAAAGFRKIVITGGEPLAHLQRLALLETLSELRKEIKPAQIVLRTNLAYALTQELASKLGEAADQIVVSLDGDEAAHNARRGAETYAHTVYNLHLLLGAAPAAKILLTAVLSADQIEGTQGRSVQSLGNTLGLKVRFKTILPLGRGLKLDLDPAYYNSLDDSSELLAASPGPTATCGLGMNLFVGPRGECYPCYALMRVEHLLGNALEDGLAAILQQNDRYRQATVDSNDQCRVCALRYLCGGFCRAWSANSNPNAAPRDCAPLRTRAAEILLGALETLEISTVQWLAAGLPPVASESKLE
jgi:uncharacterized protein